MRIYRNVWRWYLEIMKITLKLFLRGLDKPLISYKKKDISKHRNLSYHSSTKILKKLPYSYIQLTRFVKYCMFLQLMLSISQQMQKLVQLQLILQQTSQLQPQLQANQVNKEI